MNKKIALVIGGSGGIGSETARTLSENGFMVLATYYTDKGYLADVKEKDGIKFYKMNLLDDKSTTSAFNSMYKDYGKIDVVIFSVTNQTKNKNMLDMQWKDFEDHINLQIKGMLHVIKSMKDYIKSKQKTKFVIVLTEYCAGKPPSGLSDYITAKYALMGFAKSMGAELSKYNCTVNMVSPCMVDTKLISNLPPKLVEMTAENNPLKRIALPSDVAKVILFLSSEDSDYLNGVNILVNGGGVML